MLRDKRAPFAKVLSAVCEAQLPLACDPLSLGNQSSYSDAWSSTITLTHTRLRILDINPSSDQPFVSGQCDAVLAFNGQIYNHRDLRRRLGQHFVYKTESDTETLLYAYARWGRRFVHEFRGMYAFGIWEKRDGRIVLGVDFLGIKPLYYLNDDTGLLGVRKSSRCCYCRA